MPTRYRTRTPGGPLGHQARFSRVARVHITRECLPSVTHAGSPSLRTFTDSTTSLCRTGRHHTADRTPSIYSISLIHSCHHAHLLLFFGHVNDLQNLPRHMPACLHYYLGTSLHSDYCRRCDTVTHTLWTACDGRNSFQNLRQRPRFRMICPTHNYRI
jgi:hypothetical protein